MKYKINIVSNGVAVDRISDREARKSSLIASFTAFIIAVIGLYSLATSDFESESGFAPIAVVAGGLLCIVFLIHAMFAGKLLRHLPDQVFFNNDRAIVEIKHGTSNAKKIEIPYNDVLTIDPRTISTWDSSSKRTKLSYAVTLYLKDGSSWDLMDNSSIMDLTDAFDSAVKIKNNTSLEKVTTENVCQPKLATPKLSVVHRGDEVQVHWRNNNPATMSRQLGIPLLIIVCSMFMSLLGEADEWGTLITALKTDIHNFSDLEKLPDLLGGLVFTVGIVFICLIILIVQVIRIFRVRLKANQIVVNNSLITSNTVAGLSIPIGSAGTACITYKIGGQAGVEVMRQVPTFKEAETMKFEGDLNFKTAMDLMGKSMKEGVKTAVSEFFTNNDSIPNTLAEFSFDRFSPVDVYVVKESIRQKLQSGK